MASLSDSVMKMDTQVKKLELMKVLSLADIDKLDNMSSSAIDKLYKEKVIKKAGGGMMNINDMIRPLGYKRGTRDGNLVGDREKMYSAPPLDPKDPDDLDMIINYMTFRVLHDHNRPMKENITRENYFKLTTVLIFSTKSSGLIRAYLFNWLQSLHPPILATSAIESPLSRAFTQKTALVSWKRKLNTWAL